MPLRAPAERKGWALPVLRMRQWTAREHFAAAGVCGGLALALVMCPAAAPAKIVTSELRTECKDLASQPEPDYVAFGCDVIDATGIVVQTFAVKAPQHAAPAFRKAHAPK